MKLTDTQLVILTAASQRPNRYVLPLPNRIKGGAAQKLVGALIARGLVREVEAGPDAPSWRAGDNGPVTTLVATNAAFAALGIEAGSTPTGGDAAPGDVEAVKIPAEAERAPAAHTTPAGGKTREGTKQAALVAMLRRKEGATIAQIVEATGWQPHTVRGAFAGALKKRLGLVIASEKVEGRGRVYRVAG
jgi:Protein of unknown function (DUF3489)